jgi:hypothetical protein
MPALPSPDVGLHLHFLFAEAAVKSTLDERASLITEKVLQQAIIECAQALGYKVAHFRPAMTEHGYRTAVAADGKGFPDLVITGHRRIIFAELKSQKGKLSKEQAEWMMALRAAGGWYRLWTPADWLSGAVESDLA